MTKEEMIIRKRENRRKKWTKEKLDTKNAFGNRDLTPYNAVNQIRGNKEITL